MSVAVMPKDGRAMAPCIAFEAGRLVNAGTSAAARRAVEALESAVRRAVAARGTGGNGVGDGTVRARFSTLLALPFVGAAARVAG